MKTHPDDAAFLERLTFTTGQPCDYGRGQHSDAPTVAYGDDWICRDDLAWRLHLERCHSLDTARAHAPCLVPAQ